MPNQTVNRTPKAYRFWFPPLALRRRLPSALGLYFLLEDAVNHWYQVRDD